MLCGKEKKLHWYSTFGEIEVQEQTYLDKRNGQLRRPFQTAAQIQCRGYSLPLQRAITDFGADNAFGTADVSSADAGGSNRRQHDSCSSDGISHGR